MDLPGVHVRGLSGRPVHSHIVLSLWSSYRCAWSSSGKCRAD